MKNYNVLVKDRATGSSSCARFSAGGTDRSYGIQVARLAGLPEQVLDRAREVLGNLEGGEFAPGHVPRIARGHHAPAARRERDQLSLFAAPSPPNPALVKLKALDPDSLTPIEALKVLYELKKEV